MPHHAGQDGPHLEPCKAIINPQSQHGRLLTLLDFSRPLLTFSRDSSEVPWRMAVKRLFGHYGNVQGVQGAIVLERIGPGLRSWCQCGKWTTGVHRRMSYQDVSGKLPSL